MPINPDKLHIQLSCMEPFTIIQSDTESNTGTLYEGATLRYIPEALLKRLSVEGLDLDKN